MSRHAALGEDLAVVDDGHARAQLLELGEDVAADDDGLAHRPQFAEQLTQLDPCARVEAGRRLVEQEHLRIVDQRVRQAEALLHPARQRLDVGVALVGEVDELEQVADHPAPRRRAEAVAAGEEVEVLPDLHVVVDPERVRHEPEDATYLVGVPGDGPAGDLGLTGRRQQERREHPERRGLARAVRPDETEDLALGDVEVDAGHRDRPVVALDQAVGADDGGHSIVPVIATSTWKPTWSARSLT